MVFKTYDKAKWHYDSKDFPYDILPIACGATHIAFFLRWCIENDLLNKELKKDCIDELKSIELGDFNVRDFFMNYMDGSLTSEELNTKGQKFANSYYTSTKTKFAKNFGYYLEDYDKLTMKYIKEPYTSDNWYFYFENSEENYLLIKDIIDQRYKEYMGSQQQKAQNLR